MPNNIRTMSANGETVVFQHSRVSAVLWTWNGRAMDLEDFQPWFPENPPSNVYDSEWDSLFHPTRRDIFFRVRARHELQTTPEEQGVAPAHETRKPSTSLQVETPSFN